MGQHNKVLVLGGSGFVGSALIPALLDAKNEVTLLNRGSKSVRGVQQIVADRYDKQALGALDAGFDFVIDTSSYDALATQIAYSAFGGPSTLWLHLSSAAVYRKPTSSGAREADLTGGAEIWGDYGRNKSASEDMLAEIATGPYVSLRPPYLYGPGNNNDRETFIWSRVLSNRNIIVPGTGDARLQFLHIADLAALFLYFIENVPETPVIYNVAEPTIIRVRDWVDHLAHISGRAAQLHLGSEVAAAYTPRSYFPFRDIHCAVNLERLFTYTSWRPTYSFDAGFATTFQSYDHAELAVLSPTTEAEQLILAGILLQ